MRPTALLAAALATALGAPAAGGSDADEAFLRWPADRAHAIGHSMRTTGRVGGVFDLRVQNRNRSYNYKLRATWLTPDVIRAAARLEQLRSRLTDEETRQLVSSAEAAADTIVLVEIDPREGSGVIPTDWVALLQPRTMPDDDDDDDDAVRGVEVPRLRDMPALRGTVKRDYAYDQFWVTFPLTARDGTALFSDAHQQAEIVVRIHEKEGRATWTIPASIRERQRRITSRP